VPYRAQQDETPPQSEPCIPDNGSVQAACWNALRIKVTPGFGIIAFGLFRGEVVPAHPGLLGGG